MASAIAFRVILIYIFAQADMTIVANSTNKPSTVSMPPSPVGAVAARFSIGIANGKEDKKAFQGKVRGVRAAISAPFDAS